jgi:beta-lactamase regulating signal transducer with metallopeptidase domain
LIHPFTPNAMTTLSWILDWLMTASVRASGVVLLVIALQFLLKRGLGARARYALWLPVLLVLLSPAFPESRWSVASVLVTAPSVPSAVPQVREAPQPEMALDITQNAGQIARRQSIDWKRVWPAVWLAGCALMMIVLGVSHTRTLRRCGRTRLPVSDALQAEINRIAEQIGLRRAPLVWRSPEIQSPAVTAVLKPLLLLPAQFETHFTPHEARLILQHELTHLKRHDLPLNALMCLLITLHWFNPVLWFAFFNIRADREAACDAQVLADAAPERRRDYGHALLKVESAFAPAPLSLGFIGLFQRGAALRRRIQSIANPHPTAPAMKLLTLTLVSALTFLGVTRAATEPEASPEIFLDARFIEIRGDKNQPASADAELEKALDGLAKTTPNSGPVKAVLDDPGYQLLIRRISSTKGVDLMAAPRMTTRSGQKATVEVTREFLNPAGKPVEGPQVGVMLDVLPTLTSEGLLELALNSKIVEFDGFVDGPNDEKKPVFSERKVEARAALKPGQSALLDLGIRTDTQDVQEEDASGKIISQHQDTYTRRAIVLVTARVADSPPEPAPAKAFSNGKSAFRPGDSIRIRQVQRGNGFMTVTADYELASTDSANLSLHITSTTSSAGVKTSHTQSKTISKGKGTVVLHHPDLYEGLPHLTFYDTQSGQAMGGIYFGTPAEAEASQKLNLNYMLKTTSKVPAQIKASTPGAAEARQYDFSKANLGDVLRFLATETGLQFVSLSEGHPTSKKLVTFSLMARPFDILVTLCRAFDLELSQDQDVWHIRPNPDDELIGKVYPHPMTIPVDTILGDIRSVLGVDGKVATATPKGNVLHKPADDTFHVNATQLQHTWVEAYFKGLGHRP